jgi:two-component system phosphate regulon response regulator PhoB
VSIPQGFVTDSIAGHRGAHNDRVKVKRASDVSTAVGAGFETAKAAAAPVVLFEDDEILRRLTVAVLESEGFEVLHTTDGDDALDLVATAEPSLLILDANVSSPSSSEFLRRLRRSESSALPPVLALIMPGQSGLRRITRALGVSEFIGEPFEPAELVRRVRGLVEGPTCSV